jgi:hypothetical protein
VVDSILLTDWHPLDHRPAPDYVPACWDGPHVGKRLVDGLRTLAIMPMPHGPSAVIGRPMPMTGPICSRSRKPTRSKSSSTSARQTVPGCGRLGRDRTQALRNKCTRLHLTIAETHRRLVLTLPLADQRALAAAAQERGVEPELLAVRVLHCALEVLDAVLDDRDGMAA